MIKIFALEKTQKPAVTKNAAAKKLRTRSNLLIFLATKNAVISVNGNIHNVPTHQLAENPMVKARIATATAAGLNICFLPIARIYFEDIASAAAQAKNCKS